MTTGFTCGSFDLFHAGHVLMLKEARSQCDRLIVGIQTNPTLDRKDKNKPVQSIIERQIQVGACKYVDQIVVYETERDLIDLLTTLDIQMRIMDVNYEFHPEKITGRSICERRGITFYFNKRMHGWSTTELRQRIKKK